MTAPSWRTIDAMEQARWARLVRRHSADHDYCAELRRHLDAGARLTAYQCAELGRLAVKHGWKLPVAGSRNRKPRRRRR